MRFEIPIADGRMAYMTGDEDSSTAIVWVPADIFSKLWHPSQKFDVVRTQERYPDAENAFQNSAQYPVPVAIASIYDYDGHSRASIKLDNGITRTTWLLDHGACSFPVACSPSQVDDFLKLSSTNPSDSLDESNLPGQGRGKRAPCHGISAKLRSLFRLTKKAS